MFRGAVLYAVKRLRIIFAVLIVFLIIYLLFNNEILIENRTYLQNTLRLAGNSRKVESGLTEHQESVISIVKNGFSLRTNISFVPALRNTSSIAATASPISVSSSLSKSSPVLQYSSGKHITQKKLSRCKEVRRRVSFGVVDYVQRDGDPELLRLLQPIFTRKKLVVWSVDHHSAPIADIRSLIEPLGVEFLEHTLYSNCELMCTCDMLKLLPVFNSHNIAYLKRGLIDQFYRETLGDRDILRSDAFLVAYTIPLILLYERYNRSVIAVDAIRYERTLWYDVSRWREMNDRIRTFVADRRHVIGANSLYDVEYIHYFSGARPDYVPSFCAYTGNAIYNPTRESFLYSHRPHRKLGKYWSEPFGRHYRRIKATFKIEDLKTVYKLYDYSDLASHLGIVYLPYQV